MKSMMKILVRYVISAAGVALMLLIVNVAGLITWTVQSAPLAKKDYRISELAGALSESEGSYKLTDSGRKIIDKNFAWAMLLDEKGKVVWSENLPDEIPRLYTVPDTAGFAHWYLKGYPVYVWKHQDGLLVLGSPKGSIWKHGIELPQKVMDNTLVWIPAILILNGAAAVLLALLFGLRLFHSLKPLAKGIEDLAENKPVELSEKGLLCNLAAGINTASIQLTRQEAALRKRDTLRTTWIAGVSHDIRTPLSVVLGYASQLEEDQGLTEVQREQAGMIRRQSERIKTLVNDLNLASKLEYDMQPIRKNRLIPAELLRQTAADFLNNGLPDGFSMEIMIPDEAQNVCINGDEELLGRAVVNLISNCIRHNPQGCAITLNLEKERENCFIGVSDNGTGFREDVLQKLNIAASPDCLENHGLGLMIVRQIARVHGGKVSFRDLPEGGCRVVLCLPG